MLGSLFAQAAAARVEAYRRGLLRQQRLRGPVVSVGNLSVGGSGKTPVVRRCAEILREAGLRVAVLSRGYGGSFRGPALIVSDGERVDATAELAGDEPVMLARALPGVVVAVGRRRDVVGRAVEERFGPLVHVLDDGFQHLRLRRDLDMLCLDVKDLLDRPLPEGRLREAPAAAGRAHVVLLTRIDVASEAELQALEERLGARAHAPRRPPAVRLPHAGRRARGTARPRLPAGGDRAARAASRATSPRAQAAIVGRAFFRDHHRFTAAELEDAARRAQQSRRGRDRDHGQGRGAARGAAAAGAARGRGRE